jgi:hypothetical protein
VAVRVVGFAFLQVPAVAQQDLAQILGSRRTEYASGETVLYEQRQIAGMIEMRVRQHDLVDFSGCDRERRPITQPQGFVSLEQPAVDEDFLCSGIEQIAGTRYGTCGAEKFETQGCGWHFCSLSAR